MNDEAAYLLACHNLRAVCIVKGIDCEGLCMLLPYEKRPCDRWANKKSIKEYLKEKK